MARAAMCYPFIEAEKQGDHNVKRACELLKVSRSAYYADRAGGPSPRAQRDAEMTAKIVQFYAEDHDRFTGDRDLDRAGALNPALESFATWLTNHRDELKPSQN